MKYIILLYLIFVNFNQMSYAENLNLNIKITGKKNFLHEIPIFHKEYNDYYRNTIIDTNFNFKFQKYSKYVSGILRLKKNGFI